MKKTLLAVLLCVTVLSLCSLGVAADRHPAGASTVVRNAHPVNPNADTGLKKIFTNLGPSGDLYDATVGYFVSGINNGFNGQKQDIAIPFTPKKASTVTKVEAALQYYNLGTNAAVVGIYKDASGLPGKVLASKLLKNFSDFGTGCCALANWKLATPLAVKKGTQYWIVGTTNKKSADAINTFDWVYNDAAGNFAFQQDDGGWIYLSAAYGYPPSACAALGTQP